MNDTVQLKQLSAELRGSITRKLQEEAAARGGTLKFGSMPRVLQDGFGVDYKEYTRERLIPWMLKTFPIEQVDQYSFALTEAPAHRLADPALDECVALFRAEIERNGFVYLSSIRSMLTDAGLPYEYLLGGKKLKEWLQSWIRPMFEISEDGCKLLTGNTGACTVCRDTSGDEVQQLIATAFMFWWNENLKTVKQFTDTDLSAEGLREAVAHALARAALGVDGHIRVSGEEDDTRLTFPIGMTAKNGTGIYCVLRKNPFNVNGDKQEWALHGFTHAGDMYNPELSAWLVSTFPETADVTSGRRSVMEVLDKHTTALEQACQALAAVLPQLTAAAENGVPLSDEAVSAVTAYRDGWTRVREVLVGNPRMPQEFACVQDVRAYMEAGGEQLFAAQVDKFMRLADDTVQYFERIIGSKKADAEPDKEAVKALAERALDEQTVTAFLEKLRPYEMLRAVMCATCPGDLENGADSAVLEHFRGLTPHLLIYVYNASAGHRAFTDAVLEIRDALETVLSGLTAEENTVQAQPLTAVSEQMAAENGIAYAYTFPRNPFERAVATDDREAVTALLTDVDAMADMGYTLQQVEAFAAVYAALPEDYPTRLTFMDTACRLQTVCGGSAAQAIEKFATLALTTDKDAAVRLLLTLHRRQKNLDKFSAVHRAYGDGMVLSAEDEAFYLEEVCRAGYDAVKAYVADHVYCLYDVHALSVMLERLDEQTCGGFVENLRARLERLQALPALNAFEETVVQGDVQAVRRFADDSERMAALGYTPEEVDGIRESIVQELETFTAGDAAAAGRLFALQGNRNGAAERYYWKSLSAGEGGRTETLVQLCAVLVEDGRYEDCVALYTCYEKSCDAAAACRKLLMQALAVCDPSRSCKFVTANLSDYLMAITSNAQDIANRGLAEQLDRMTAHKDAAVREYYEWLRELLALIRTPIVRSVALVDRELRTLVLQKELLVELGLSEQQADACAGIYKNDSYSHERDALGIARRLYTFLGVLNGVAEAFATFALAQGNEDSARLLWRIYTDTNDQNGKCTLLMEHPAMQAEHKREYRRVLFDRQMYADLLTLLSEETEPDMQDRVLSMIVHLKLEVPYDAAIPTDWEFGDVDAGWIQELLQQLLADGRTQMYIEFLLHNFGGLQAAYTSEQVRAMFAADAQVLEALQTAARGTDRWEEEPQLPDAAKQALYDGRQALAVYIYTVCGVGDLQEEAEAYYAGLMRKARNGDRETATATYRRAERLFPDKAADIGREQALLNISSIVADGEVTEFEMNELCRLIAAVDLTADTLRQLLAQLSAVKVLYNETICTILANGCSENGLLREGMAFLEDCCVKFNEPYSSVRYTLLCQLYLEALEQALLTEEETAHAEEVFLGALKESAGCVAAYGVYCIERARGNAERADGVLLYLADATAEEIGEQLSEKIDAALWKTWGNEIPTALGVLTALLARYKVEELEQQFAFMRLFAMGKEISLEDTDGILTEDRINDIVYTIYAAPASVDWDTVLQLPFDDALAEGAKLGLFACRREPQNAERWLRLATYCVQYELNEMLLPLLIEAAQSVNVKDKGLQCCREWLSDRLEEDHDFLRTYGTAEQLITLVRVHAQRLGQDAWYGYEAIKTLAQIAVETGEPQAWDVLVELYRDTLFGDSAGLSVWAACRMLVSNRIAEAREILDTIVASGIMVNYRAMVEELVQLDDEAITVWLQSEENRMLVDFVIQEHGNRLALEAIQTFTVDCIETGRQELGARVLRRLLAMFSSDYVLLSSLFTLCKSDFTGRLALLHSAVCGLAQQSAGGRRSFYRLCQSDYAKLLAYLNAAVISSERCEEVAAVSAYDFTKSAGDFYGEHVNSPDLRTRQEINDIQNNTLGQLAVYQEQERKLMCNAIVAWVTDDWDAVFGSCAAGEISFAEVFRLFPSFNAGFTRAVLRFARSLEKGGRAMCDTIRAAIDEAWPHETEENKRCKDKISRVSSMHTLLSNVTQEYFACDLLLYPLEEWSLFNEILYGRTVEQVLSKAPASVATACTMAVYLLTESAHSAEAHLNRQAKEAFEQKQDMRAAILSTALNGIRRDGVFRREHEEDVKNSVKTYNPNLYNVNNERVEAYSRVAKAFAGDAEIISKISGADFNVWSCINMVFVLLSTPRANELGRLTHYFDEKHRRWAEILLRVVSPSASAAEDKEKVQLIRQENDPGAVAYLSFIAKRLSNGALAYLKTEEAAVELNNLYMDTAMQYPEYFMPNSRRLKRNVLYALGIHPSAFSQIEASELTVQPMVETTEELPQEETPAPEISFASGIVGLSGSTEDIIALRQEYDAVVITGKNAVEARRQRMELSEKMYRLVLGIACPEEEQNDYRVLYGVDRCYYLLALGDDEAKAQACELVKDLALISARKGGEGHKARATLVRTTMLPRLLSSGYDTFAEMVEAYKRDKVAFTRMRDMLSDPAQLKTVNVCFRALDSAVRYYDTLAFAGEEDKRAHLSNIHRTLTGMMVWPDTVDFIRRLLNEEINRLDRKAVLDIQVFNADVPPVFGKVFGQIKNLGKLRAEQLVLQMRYGEGRMSNRYTIPYLDQKGKVTFEIDYAIPQDTTVLEYEITVTSRHGDEEQVFARADGKLAVVARDDVDFPTGIYNTETIRDFKVNENGEVYSPHFYGRSAEKRQIAGMFRGDDFVGYKNVIVRGIRRSGKSSLLHYLKAYVQAKCVDAVAVFVDCQGVTDRPIQTVFIDRVLKQLDAELPELYEREEWAAFAARWELPVGDEDRNPQLLQDFYCELRAVTGKGLVLVVDEIDVLFDRIEKTQGLDHSLFPALGGMLCSDLCQRAVHFVICGSNQLIRYGLDGGTLSQLFQRFGDNVIEVGRLTPQDMREMLTNPYSDFADVRYTEEALDWVWNCTGGLAWYTKLLANAVMTRLHRENRATVYPSDVCVQLNEILRDSYFSQLRTGCLEKEAAVLDALQSMTATPTAYVSVDRIAELLADRLTARDVDITLGNLVSLQLLQRNPSDRRACRFAVTLYWYYFRQTASDFARVKESPQMFSMETAAMESYEDNENW